LSLSEALKRNGFSEEDLESNRHATSRVWHAKDAIPLEPVFLVLAGPKMKRGEMKKLAVKAKVSILI
jgi:hypothetical protein